MDDNTFIRYDNLGNLDSRVTCVTSLDNVLFLGNSYGDIRIVKGVESQILHNHHGEITNLVCRRCYRTSRNDTLYLLSGTSIGNVYLHLVFLDKLTGSRILYKFITGYCVFSICPHPEFDVFNFKRLTNRLTVDFTKDVSKDSDNWKELPSLSISVESFILSLSNGCIYLVHNSNSFNNYNKNSPKEKENNKLSNNDQVNEEEKFVIMCISVYCPYTNMKMNWYERYISWIDKEGFYVYLLPNFVSIIYIPSKHFGNNLHKLEKGLGFKDKMKKTQKIHYLYNIIDNNELYVSTEESDISPSGDFVKGSSNSGTSKISSHSENNYENNYNNNIGNKDNISSTNDNNFNKNNLSKTKDNKDKNKEKNNNRKLHMKKLKNRMVNHKYLRNNNNYGTMSRFLSDSLLVGCNNTLLCIKLVEDYDQQSGEYHNLLLSTFPNKEVIGYKDMRKNIGCRRSTSVVRGYIDFKLVFPEYYNILYILYSSQSQFNIILFDEGFGKSNFDNQNIDHCYQFEKYNRNGSVTIHKFKLPDDIKPGVLLMEDKNKIINMIFNLNSSGSDGMCLISLVDCEPISLRYLKGDFTLENIIIGSPSCPETSSKNDVYICVKDSLIRINYCSNYFNLLKYYITNCYNQNIVIGHFKSNLNSMLNNIISCTTGEFKSIDDYKESKYILDYIKVFVNYLLEIKNYEGFKVILRALNRCGKLGDYFGSIFTEYVKIRLGILGFYEKLVEDLVEIIDDGDCFMYLQVVDWKLSSKVYNNLLKKIKTILVNHIYHLYNLFLDSELRTGIDTENKNKETDFPNGSYFDVLLLLNDLNSKTEVELMDLYNLLYQFLQQTAFETSKDNILKYRLSNRFTKNINNNINNKNNNINNNNNEMNTYNFDNYDPSDYLKFLNSFNEFDGFVDYQNFRNSSNFSNIGNILYNKNKNNLSKTKDNNKPSKDNKKDKDKSKSKDSDISKGNKNKDDKQNENDKYDENSNECNNVEKTRLQLYLLENEEIYNRLLSLKYYHKSLTEKLVSVNTRGVVFPGNPSSGMIRGPESWYIQRAVINCNICNSQRVVYENIVSKLSNRIRGKQLKQTELVIGTLLYFPCKHLVHEKCQIHLINHIIQHSEVDTSITFTKEPGVYFSNELLNTCLTCLTR